MTSITLMHMYTVQILVYIRHRLGIVYIPAQCLTVGIATTVQNNEK